MRKTLSDKRPRITVALIVLLCVFVTYHSYNDWVTTRDVAHNKDVVIDICKATNQQNAAIRTVLIDGIRSARRAETFLPQFKAQYDEQIRRSQGYLDRLFVIQHCSP